MPGGDTSNGQSGTVVPLSPTFHQITPPKYLDLKHSGEIAENWKLWKEKYNNYFVISRLDRETPEFQLAMFKHTIGDDALKVIKTFNYAEGENSSDWRVVSVQQWSQLIVLLPSGGIWPKHVIFAIVCRIV